MNGNTDLKNGNKQIVELTVKKFYSEGEFVNIRIEDI